MKRRKNKNTHENPENTNNKKHGCGRRESPNHIENRCFNVEKKGSKPIKLGKIKEGNGNEG